MTIKERIAEAYRLQQQINDKSERLTKQKDKIIEKLLEHGKKKFTFASENDVVNGSYTASVTSRTMVKYDNEKLREVLGDDTFNEITHISVTIDNPYEFLKVMKKCGLSKKQVMKFATLSRVLDKDKLNNLYDVGDITLDKIKSCYTTSTSNSLKLSYQEESDCD
jgi:hypothetical protein